MTKQKPLTDLGIEKAVLSTICRHGSEAFFDIADIISLSSFTDPSNQGIFKCLEAVIEDKNSIDIPTLISKAEQLKLTRLVCQEKEDLEYIRALFAYPSAKENIRSHAKRLVKLELTRDARRKHMEAYENLGKIEGDETIDHIMSISEKPIFEMITTMNQGRETLPNKLGDGIREYVEHLKTKKSENVGVPTPFPIYNKVIGGGLRRGGVNLIVARPKNNKTTFGVETGLFVAEANMPVLFLDTEMVITELYPRILADFGDIDIDLIETGKFSKIPDLSRKIDTAMTRMESLGFYHKSIAGKPFDEILSIIRRWLIQNVGYTDGKMNNCLVIYDYFKLMSESEMDSGLGEHQILGFRISKLADFSKEYDFPILSFVQANRDGLTKETSDIIAQSDRLLWLCHSATVLKNKTQEEIVEDGPNYGNMKLKPFENGCRFGPGLSFEDYICLDVTKSRFQMKEIGTRFDQVRESQERNTGFGEAPDGLQF